VAGRPRVLWRTAGRRSTDGHAAVEWWSVGECGNHLLTSCLGVIASACSGLSEGWQEDNMKSLRAVRLFATVLFLVSAFGALELRARANTDGDWGRLCSRDLNTCFCNGNSCECPDYGDCSQQYPEFCDDMADLCDAWGGGLAYCDAGGESTPCQGSCSMPAGYMWCPGPDDLCDGDCIWITR